MFLSLETLEIDTAGESGYEINLRSAYYNSPGNNMLSVNTRMKFIITPNTTKL